MEQLIVFAGDNLLWVSLWVALLLLLAWNLFGHVAMGVNQVDPQEMTRLINHERALVLDIRPAEDFQRGHVLGAVNIPESELGTRKQELKKSKDKPVIVVDQNGTSAPRALRLLKQDGYTTLSCLKGGLVTWQRASMPLSQPSGKAVAKNG